MKKKSVAKKILLYVAFLGVFVGMIVAGYATDSMHVGRMTRTGSFILLTFTTLEIPIMVYLFGPSPEVGQRIKR
jgi:hypothetical protein